MRKIFIVPKSNATSCEIALGCPKMRYIYTVRYHLYRGFNVVSYHYKSIPKFLVLGINLSIYAELYLVEC